MEVVESWKFYLYWVSEALEVGSCICPRSVRHWRLEAVSVLGQ